MKNTLAVLLLAVFLSGCPRNSVYHEAVTIEHDATYVVVALQQAEIAEFNAGRIPPPEHQQFQGLFEKVGLAGQALVLALQRDADSATVRKDLDVLLQTVADLSENGVLGIKNEQSRERLKTAVQALRAILAHLQTTLAVPMNPNGEKP